MLPLIAIEQLEDRSLLTAPVITPPSFPIFSENTSAPTTLGVISAYDPDGGMGMGMMLSLSAADPIFSLDPSGMLSLQGPFTQPSYSLSVYAMDDDMEMSSSSFMISVSDDNNDGIIGDTFTGGGGGDTTTGGGGGDTTTGGGGGDGFPTMQSNQAPDAVVDGGPGFTTDEDTPFTTPSLLANDSDADGDPLSISSVGMGMWGFANPNSDGTVTYTPAMLDWLSQGDAVTDTINYTITDGRGGSDTASITITITGVNDPPDAVDDSGFYTHQNTTLNISLSTLLTNDTDPDDTLQPMNVTLGSATNGTATLVGLTVDFVPAAGFIGTASFVYTVSDNGGLSDSATVTINVGNVAPTAVADAYATRKDKQLIVLAPGVLSNDNDSDGDVMTPVLEDVPTNGSLALNANGSFSYTPNTGFIGNDTFSYHVNDGAENSNTVVVSIKVVDVDTSDSFGVAWEGDAIEFYLKATSSSGVPMTLEVDVNDDGIYDASGSYDAAISGVLLEGVALNLLGAHVDNGDYTAKIRVTLDNYLVAVDDLTIHVGNTPAEIVLGESTTYDSGNTAPGADFPLTVSISDPGPDTISSLQIDWGDGQSQTFSTVSASYSHQFATVGEYIITVTATDEDGAHVANRIVNIGDNDAATSPSPLPIITTANATLVAGGAEITINAEDAAGNSVATIIWDLNGDDSFSDASGPTVTIPFDGSGSFPYVAAVQITDNFGNTTELMFAFAGAGPATPQPTKNTFREYFRNATPDAPMGWAIHHTYQQALRDRALKDWGINVDETQRLRAVPQHVHDEISRVQMRWWRNVADKDYGRDLVLAFRLTPKAQIDGFMAQLDATYSKWWISSGPDQKTKVTAITNDLESNQQVWVLNKPQRWSAVGVDTNHKLFDMIAKYAPTATKKLKDHGTATAEFTALCGVYESCADKIRGDGLTNAAALDLVSACKNYFTAKGVDSVTVGLFYSYMMKWVLLNIP